mmetsp:Transcript_40594/g.74143  ORF Transcript_40594/g.74143 Transcript_40594/m.74143 type:complete len:374 (+) Transcript_40594:126-1247(+)
MRLVQEGDEEANGLPAVWYGPTIIKSEEQIQEDIFDENKAAFIQFGSNKSARTNYMMYAFDKLGRYMYRSQTIVIARVDCRATPDLCKTYRVTKYPTLRYYKMGAESRADSMRYHGNYAYDNMKAFVMKELGGLPVSCPLIDNAATKEDLEEKDVQEGCTPLERRFMQVHLNKTYPKIVAIIREIKKRERLLKDKVKFPMKMVRLEYHHKALVEMNPEKKPFYDREYEKNKTEAEKAYVEKRLEECRLIRTMKHVEYFNRMVHKAWKEEGIGAGLPPPDDVWIKWTKYQNKMSGGNKAFITHENGTSEQVEGTRAEDLYWTDEERTFEYMEGVDEFLDDPKWNAPKENYPERFPEYAKKTLPEPKKADKTASA